MKKLIVVCMSVALMSFAVGATAQISDADVWSSMLGINGQLEEMGENVRLGMVEYYTASDEVGGTVFFKDTGNKRLAQQWVPGDPRRGGFLDIAWISDQAQGAPTGVSLAETQAAISRAMATWDGVKCSDIPLTQLPDSGLDWGYVQWLVGFGGIPFFTDILQSGFLPGFFFDFLLGPGAGNSVLGVTFSFWWVDDEGNPTDIDNDGYLDKALADIYYNDAFQWAIDPAPVPGPDPIDIETVVLHETGHGLAQEHFGKLFRTNRNGKFHFAPRAVMNAGYTGIQQEIRKTDKAGHCSIWASWPNN